MKNHAACIPFPGNGHVRPMLKLAQLLHFNYGFHITFINTHHYHQTLFPSHQNSNPTFKFESILDDSKDLVSAVDSVMDYSIGPPLKELLIKLGTTCDDSTPPVTCIISDVQMSNLTLDVAEVMEIPAVAFEVISAGGMMAYLGTRQLLNRGILPIKDSSCLDMVIDLLPSLKGIRLKDLPYTISGRRIDQSEKDLKFWSSSEYRALDSQAIIINTFDALEQDVLKDLSSFTPNIYAIGPLNLLHNNISEDSIIKFPLPSLSREDSDDYMQWLNSQESNSVLYVCLGTIVTLTAEEFDELAWGIANSNHKFFWALKPDLVNGRSNYLPLGFKEEVKEKSILVCWCDQKRVLGHPSIRAFVTHCGWNSMIESISNGVPMICWPRIFAEIGLNCWFYCYYLEINWYRYE